MKHDTFLILAFIFSASTIAGLYYYYFKHWLAKRYISDLSNHYIEHDNKKNQKLIFGTQPFLTFDIIKRFKGNGFGICLLSWNNLTSYRSEYFLVYYDNFFEPDKVDICIGKTLHKMLIGYISTKKTYSVDVITNSSDWFFGALLSGSDVFEFYKLPLWYRGMRIPEFHFKDINSRNTDSHSLPSG